MAIALESLALHHERGTNWRGPCPFHGGTNRRALSVDLAADGRTGVFLCHTCGETGRVLEGLLLPKGASLPEGMRPRLVRFIPRPQPSEEVPAAMGAALAWAAEQYRAALRPPGREVSAGGRYLARRGLRADGIGWAPGGAYLLSRRGTDGNAPDPDLPVDAGLIRASDRRDMLQQRVVTPYHWHGRTSCLHGRIIRPERPPEDPYFTPTHKYTSAGGRWRRGIFNEAALRQRWVLVTEAAFDAIAATQLYGIPACAIGGTTNTAAIRRLATLPASTTIILGFDHDDKRLADCARGPALAIALRRRLTTLGQDHPEAVPRPVLRRAYQALQPAGPVSVAVRVLETVLVAGADDPAARAVCDALAAGVAELKQQNPGQQATERVEHVLQEFGARATVVQARPPNGHKDWAEVVEAHATLRRQGRRPSSRPLRELIHPVPPRWAPVARRRAGDGLTPPKIVRILSGDVG
ncbi:MAG TPA: toprim domain-containing protein [Candidatus Dormibacteraeota bacterium]|nr:toprim domain-containing protein [Candidatus Dormibacteraeota bacterium]